MTDEPSIWNRHGKVYVDPAFERSSLIVFVEFCSDMMVSPREIDAIVGRAASATSIFHLGDIGANGLAQAMGIETAPWALARGADLMTGRFSSVFVSELRYCPSCLALGNHSTLFQLLAVTHCPVHAAALRTGCPYCGKSVSTKVHALAKNHLYCGSCHRNLAAARRRTAIGVSVIHPPAECFAALRRSLTGGLPSGESRSALRWDSSANQIVAIPTLARLYRRHTLWDSPSIDCRLLRFKTDLFHLDVEDQPMNRRDFNTLVRDVTIKAFENLGERLERYVPLMGFPKDIEWTMKSSGRVDIEVASVAAAFWRAAVSFKVNRFLRGEMPPSEAGAHPFSSWLPAHISAMRVLIHLSVLALFVHCLIQVRRLQYGVQVAWHKLPDEALFFLPWRLRPLDSGRIELHVRSRVSATTVDRLVARYQHHCLRSAPKDLPLLSLITSQKSTGASSNGGDGTPVHAVRAWPFDTE
jgi:hypothetical protein